MDGMDPCIYFLVLVPDLRDLPAHRRRPKREAPTAWKRAAICETQQLYAEMISTISHYYLTL